MRCLVLFMFFAVLVAGCSKVSDEELRAKVDKCTAAGMDYTYLKDFRGKPYDVMCVSKRLR